jgi:hypothetical protein
VKAKEEMSFTQTGGARIGWMNATIPFATLSGDQDRLWLISMGRELEFEKHRIILLSRYGGLISTGLRIEHSILTYPEFIVFWTSAFWGRSRFLSLKSRLEALGYDVFG